jgi:hypothetical protein
MGRIANGFMTNDDHHGIERVYEFEGIECVDVANGSLNDRYQGRILSNVCITIIPTDDGEDIEFFIMFGNDIRKKLDSLSEKFGVPASDLITGILEHEVGHSKQPEFTGARKVFKGVFNYCSSVNPDLLVTGTPISTGLGEVMQGLSDPDEFVKEFNLPSDFMANLQRVITELQMKMDLRFKRSIEAEIDADNNIGSDETRALIALTLTFVYADNARILSSRDKGSLKRDQNARLSNAFNKLGLYTWSDFFNSSKISDSVKKAIQGNSEWLGIVNESFVFIQEETFYKDFDVAFEEVNVLADQINDAINNTIAEEGKFTDMVRASWEFIKKMVINFFKMIGRLLMSLYNFIRNLFKGKDAEPIFDGEKLVLDLPYIDSISHKSVSGFTELLYVKLNANLNKLKSSNLNSGFSRLSSVPLRSTFKYEKREDAAIDVSNAVKRAGHQSATVLSDIKSISKEVGDSETGKLIVNEMVKASKMMVDELKRATKLLGFSNNVEDSIINSTVSFEEQLGILDKTSILKFMTK